MVPPQGLTRAALTNTLYNRQDDGSIDKRGCRLVPRPRCIVTPRPTRVSAPTSETASGTASETPVGKAHQPLRRRRAATRSDDGSSPARCAQGERIFEDQLAPDLGRQPQPGARGAADARPRGLRRDRAATRRPRNGALRRPGDRAVRGARGARGPRRRASPRSGAPTRSWRDLTAVVEAGSMPRRRRRPRRAARPQHPVPPAARRRGAATRCSPRCSATACT